MHTANASTATSLSELSERSSRACRHGELRRLTSKSCADMHTANAAVRIIAEDFL